MGYVDTVRRDLAAYRRTNGVTQQQIAELVGVSRTAISAFETGSSEAMRAKAFDRLVALIERWRALDTSAKEFVERATSAASNPIPEPPSSRPTCHVPSAMRLYRGRRTTRGFA